MEIDEALERIVRRHWWLIAACIVIPMLIVFSLSHGSKSTYLSQSRILISSTTPSSTQSADALTSHARAIATSPSIVNNALQKSGVSADPEKFSSHNVTVTELGTSPVVQLGVKAGSPADATRTAEALSDQIVNFLNDVGQGGIPDVLTQLQTQITTTNNELNSVNKQLAANPTSIALAGQATSLRGLADSLIADYDHLLVQQASQTQARIVSPATIPGGAQSSGLPQRLILAGLLGAVGGLLLSALLVALRPTVTGSARLAQALGAPRLGMLTPQRGRHHDPALNASAGRQIRFAAARLGVDTVVLAGDDIELEGIAHRIEEITAPGGFSAGPRATDDEGLIRVSRGPISASKETKGETQTEAKTRATGLRVRTLATLDHLSNGDRPGVTPDRIGLLVVAPRSLPRSTVASIQDLQATTGWPLLGVLEVQPSQAL